MASSRGATVTRPPVGYSDDTALRIRAYLDSLTVEDPGAVSPSYWHGMRLIERLASSASGTDEPSMQLSLEEAADVVYFVTLSIPREPDKWWRDPCDGPSHVVGRFFVLDAVEDAMRQVIDNTREAP